MNRRETTRMSADPKSPVAEGESSRLTVVELDLLAFSTIARTLQENVGPAAVATLIRQIKQFIDEGLATVGLSRHNTLVLSTGDGAILLFPKAPLAHHFAVAVHEHTRTHNQGKTDKAAQRLFRMGAATGDVFVSKVAEGEFEVGSDVIGNAVRLETAAAPGELLIDHHTYNMMPESLAVAYGPEELVPGKRDEIFRARRCAMNLEVPKPTAPPAPAAPLNATVGRRAILELLEQLEPTNLRRLGFLMGFSLPEAIADPFEFGEYIVTAASSAEQLQQLESELRYLIARQRTDAAIVSDQIQIHNSTVGQFVVIKDGNNNVIKS